MEDLWERLQGKSFVYPPYLGITECPAKISWATLVAGDRLGWLSDPGEPLKISTVIPVERVRPESLKLREGLQLLKDRYPLALAPGRSLASVADILHERNAGHIDLIPKGDVYHLSYEYLSRFEEEYGMFMEL